MFTILYKLPIWSSNKKIKCLIAGLSLYVILFSFIYSSYVKNKKYNKLMFCVLVADAVSLYFCKSVGVPDSIVNIKPLNTVVGKPLPSTAVVKRSIPVYKKKQFVIPVYKTSSVTPVLSGTNKSISQ